MTLIKLKWGKISSLRLKDDFYLIKRLKVVKNRHETLKRRKRQ
nr:MAG TPA: hypothetical protein [Caudoviricetes sp.]